MGTREVALVGCGNYERGVVESRVERAFDLLGGPGAVACRGDRVFVKVNALLPTEPQKAVTTHPEVVRAVVRQLKRITGDIVIGDSPGGPFNKSMLKRTYERCGFARVAADTGASLCFDTTAKDVKVPDGVTMKSVTLCRAMAETDRLVSVSKFKTHLQVNITCAVKNLFGAVPGMAKFGYHARFSRGEEFSEALLDVFLASGACFHVVDAVEGMDGNGPRQGDIFPIGIIAAGADALSVETAMMSVVGLDPSLNGPLAAAVRRGLCSGDPRDVVALGDGMDELRVDGFRLPDGKDASSRMPAFVMDRFGNMLSLRPRPSAAKCTGCAKCADICPEGAITVVGGTAVVEMRRCIRCYCCHELCEYDAIELERPFLMRMLER